MKHPRLSVRYQHSLVMAAAMVGILSGCSGAVSGEKGVPSERQETKTMLKPDPRFDIPLPDSATKVERFEDAGQDRILLLSFRAPAADAEAFAARLIPGGVQTGRDPGLGYLGKDKPWWLTSFPADASGGEDQDLDKGLVTKLVLGAEQQDGEAGATRTVWLARFSL